MYVTSEIRPPLFPRSGLKPERYLRVSPRRQQEASARFAFGASSGNRYQPETTNTDALRSIRVPAPECFYGCQQNRLQRPTLISQPLCMLGDPAHHGLLFLFYRIINKDHEFTARVYSQLKEWQEFPHQTRRVWKSVTSILSLLLLWIKKSHECLFIILKT